MLANFRPGTELKPTKFGFVYNAGGMGDYIHWTTAIQYAIETYPHLFGYIVTPHFFEDLARLWLKPYSKRFEILVTDDFTKEPLLDEVPCLVPNRSQYANANSHHLFVLGFTYYCQMAAAPKEWLHLPRITKRDADIYRFCLPTDYAVIPISATADNRRLPTKTVQGLCTELRARGIEPVFLGKRELMDGYEATSSPGLDSSWGIDLRERTNLLEAGAIMAGARLTVGLDGGLLHLACCSAAPVIFAFTSVDPATRVPPRRKGENTFIVSPSKDLPCRYCQTNMKFLLGHDFKDCLYGDNICLDAISVKALLPVIDKALALAGNSGEGKTTNGG